MNERLTGFPCSSRAHAYTPRKAMDLPPWPFPRLTWPYLALLALKIRRSSQKIKSRGGYIPTAQASKLYLLKWLIEITGRGGDIDDMQLVKNGQTDPISAQITANKPDHFLLHHPYLPKRFFLPPSARRICRARARDILPATLRSLCGATVCARQMNFPSN